MHRSFMVPVVCLAIFASGCAVDTDDPEPTEKEPPAYEPERDRLEIPMPFETLEPATEGWDLADMIQIAEAAFAEKNPKATVPGILRHPPESAPVLCVAPECVSVPNEPRLPDPGNHAR